MWASLTLDSSSLKESQALRLVGMKGEHGNTPETVQAGSLRPLRDTGPSGLKEKKVRLRHRAGVSLKDKSHCWAGSGPGNVKTASRLKESYFNEAETMEGMKL